MTVQHLHRQQPGGLEGGCQQKLSSGLTRYDRPQKLVESK